MGGQRTKNSARNMIFGVCYRIVSLVMPFAIRTIIVYKLGKHPRDWCSGFLPPLRGSVFRPFRVYSPGNRHVP